MPRGLADREDKLFGITCGASLIGMMREYTTLLAVFTPRSSADTVAIGSVSKRLWTNGAELRGPFLAAH